MKAAPSAEPEGIDPARIYPVSEVQIQYVDPKSLRPHPLNRWLYGETRPADDYVESIREDGVREPIRVTQDLMIVSGHQRCATAIAVGRKLVPIIVEPEALDDLVIRRELIICNKRRPKTREQEAREFAALSEVNADLAKKRQRDHAQTAPGRGKNTSGKNAVSVRRAKTAKEEAAATLGMSRHTAEKQTEVVKAIDQAEAAGDTAKAAELRDKLENKSVAAAHRAAKPDAAVLKAETATDTPAGLDGIGVPIPRRLEKAFAIRTTIDAVLNLLRQVKAELNKAIELPGGEELKDRAQSIDIDVKNLRAGWRFSKPFCVCPGCNASGKDCNACQKRGWITEDTFDRVFKRRHSQPVCTDQGATSVASQRT
jgi:ParB-like nuclease domain